MLAGLFSVRLPIVVRDLDIAGGAHLVGVLALVLVLLLLVEEHGGFALAVVAPDSAELALLLQMIVHRLVSEDLLAIGVGAGQLDVAELVENEGVHLVDDTESVPTAVGTA